MEFLDNLVLPQSREHIELLHYMLILILFLFIPFISVIFGGTILSLYYKFRGGKESNNIFLQFSKDIIELVTINKSIGIILGIIPVITSVLIFAQLLHTATVASVTYLFASSLLVSLALILIYTYRYSLSFIKIFSSIKNYDLKDASVAEEIKKFHHSNSSLSEKSGRYGIIFLFIGIWLFISAVTLTTYPEKWGNEEIIYVLFSWQVLSRFIQFIAASFALTGGAVLFAYFFWEGGRKNIDEDYKNFIRKTSINITFTGSIILPVFLFINTLALPGSALSGSVFFYSALALILIFIAYHFLYAMLKNSLENFSGYVFYFVFFALLAIIVKDQSAMNNATSLQTEKLGAEFDVYLTNLRGESAAVEVNGQELFDVRCSSCHRFDSRLVGPAYNDVLPKYEGKMDDLVGFILNPVKVNPQFPPMPDPGLKPNEARAVAEYIMENYKQ